MDPNFSDPVDMGWIWIHLFENGSGYGSGKFGSTGYGSDMDPTFMWRIWIWILSDPIQIRSIAILSYAAQSVILSRLVMGDLAEVFSVRVFSKHGPVSGDELYGSMVVNDHSRDVVFFERIGGPSDDSILPDGSLSLRPDCCTRGGQWAVRLKLYQEKDNTRLELCNGFLTINLSDAYLFYNRPLTGIIQGRDGHALVDMVMLTSAVQATVEVSLVAQVVPALYGHIRARTDFFKNRNPEEKKIFQTTMFSASKDKASYTNGSQIPLSRCMTPVPLHRKLIIEAYLFDPLTNMRVAVDTASFVACRSGSQTQTIEYIQIKVTWTEV